MTRRSTLLLFALASLVVTIGYAQNRSRTYRGHSNSAETPVADRQGTDPGELDGADGSKLRLREGMKFVNRIGELQKQGGRILFQPDGGNLTLELLENLALERVWDDLDQPHRKWSVTGIVTEFKGGNFLLLQRAVLKARTSKSPPRS